MRRAVVVDDVKVFPFPDSVEVTYCRNLADAALELLTDRPIGQLWLDHDLGGDETVRPLVRSILARLHYSNPLHIECVVVCSLNAPGAAWIEDSLSPYYRVIRCTDPGQAKDILATDERVRWY